MPDVFWRDQLVSARTPYTGRKGESNNLSVMEHSQPNIFMSYVNGGYGWDVATTAGQDPYDLQVRNQLWNADIDVPLYALLFERVRFGVKGRIPYGPGAIQLLFRVLHGVLSSYYSLKALLWLATNKVDELVDLPQAMHRKLDLDTNSPADIAAVLSEIKQMIETFPLPGIVSGDVAWMFHPRRSEPASDAPIIMYSVPPIGANGVSLSTVKTDGTQFSLDGNGWTRSKVNNLKNDVMSLLSSAPILKVASDLLDIGIPRVTVVEYGAPAFDLEFLNLWQNQGVGINDAAIFAAGDDMIIPNASNSDESKRLPLVYYFAGEPTERIMRNLCFGVGDANATVFNHRWLNHHGSAGAAGNLDVSAGHLPFQYFGLDDPTNLTEIMAWKEVNERLVLDGASNDWSAFTAELLTAFQKNIKGTSERWATNTSLLKRAYPGHRAVYQIKDSLAVADQLEGVHPLIPMGGSRHYVDPIRLVESVFSSVRAHF